MDVCKGVVLDVVEGLEILTRQSQGMKKRGMRGCTGAMASSEVAFRSVREALLILGGGVSGSMISSTLAMLCRSCAVNSTRSIGQNVGNGDVSQISIVTAV